MLKAGKIMIITILFVLEIYKERREGRKRAETGTRETVFFLTY